MSRYNRKAEPTVQIYTGIPESHARELEAYADRVGRYASGNGGITTRQDVIRIIVARFLATDECPEQFRAELKQRSDADIRGKS